MFNRIFECFFWFCALFLLACFAVGMFVAVQTFVFDPGSLRYNLDAVARRSGNICSDFRPFLVIISAALAIVVTSSRSLTSTRNIPSTRPRTSRKSKPEQVTYFSALPVHPAAPPPNYFYVYSH